MRHAEGVPALCRLPPLLWSADAAADPGFDAKRAWITTRSVQIVAQTRQLARRPFVRVPEWYPPLAISCRPSQHRLNTTTEPDRDGPLDRQRIDASVLNAIECALKRHCTLGPEPVHEHDLLRLASPPDMPVLTKGRIFHRVPADANAEAQTPAGDNIHLGRLLSHKGRLPLRQ